MNQIAKEILTANYWEHFKLAKDLSMIFEIDHPRRIEVEKSLEDIRQKLYITNGDIKI